jgi:ankyrin repeat protein
VVELLLAHDPQLVDLAGTRGRTALISAAANGHEEVVALLLAHGADPHKEDTAEVSAIEWAAHEGHLAVVGKLLAHTPDRLHHPVTGECPALLAAAHGGQAHVVRELLARGADPRRRGEAHGPLELAAAEGHQEVVEVLLEFDNDLVR